MIETPPVTVRRLVFGAAVGCVLSAVVLVGTFAFAAFEQSQGNPTSPLLLLGVWIPLVAGFISFGVLVAGCITMLVVGRSSGNRR